jgi:predicted GNAT family acetyltransferase
MERKEYTLIDNQELSQYEFDLGEFTPKIEYQRKGNKIYLIHTEVPAELEGQGIAAQLVKKALADIQEQELTLVPLCPFVASYLKRHPEWNRLVGE